MSALQLVLAGDPTLLRIVRLSLIVSLSATPAAATIGMPLRRLRRAVAFPRPRRADRGSLNALMGLPPVVVGLAVFLAAVAIRSTRSWDPGSRRGA